MAKARIAVSSLPAFVAQAQRAVSDGHLDRDTPSEIRLADSSA